MEAFARLFKMSDQRRERETEDSYGLRKEIDDADNFGPAVSKYKFNEDTYIDEIQTYIDATYGQHYSREKFQATEFIYDAGHGTGFNIGNALKYLQRYGKKGTRTDARKDIMKAIHYSILQLYIHDTEDPGE